MGTALLQNKATPVRLVSEQKLTTNRGDEDEIKEKLDHAMQGTPALVAVWTGRIYRFHLLIWTVGRVKNVQP